MRFFIGIIAALMLAAGLYYGTSSDPAPAYALDGKPADPLASEKPVLLLFTRDDCPISNRYAPEVQRLYARFADTVDFYLVYPDPNTDADAIQTHLHEYGYAIPALRDPDHALVDLSAATITPEAALYLPGQQLIYRGRIDNRYVEFGTTRPRATQHDLHDILAALEAGETPDSLRTTEAVGCYIADLK